MELELKPDFDASYARYEAFWEHDVLDRPPVCITLPLAATKAPATAGAGRTASDDIERHAMETLPPALTRRYMDHRSRWLDLPGRVEREVWRLEHTAFLGDALPVAWPNMGPEIFSAWCGAGYEFGETTTWSVPCVEDWHRDGPACRFDENHDLFRATMELTELLIEAGRGRFIVGLTDFHAGGDHLAALRDPERLAIDLLDEPEAILPMLSDAATDYFRAYDMFYERIASAGMPATSWLPLVHFGRYYIPSNDFSALISPAMFERFFLDGIVDECRFLDRSIYHLDGPDALRHLDMLLEIPELDAIQFVPGAGNEDLEQWIPVYQRIQQAGKSQMILDVTTGNMEALFEHLSPEGIYVGSVGGVRDESTANAVLARFENWA